MIKSLTFFSVQLPAGQVIVPDLFLVLPANVQWNPDHPMLNTVLYQTATTNHGHLDLQTQRKYLHGWLQNGRSVLKSVVLEFRAVTPFAVETLAI